jgi:hypothetical protein
VALDFTLNKYRELCQSAQESSCTVLTVEAYLSSKNPPEECIVLRHDVDRKPYNALRMAKLENQYGLKATYYFRINNAVFVPDLIREIAAMGHEIGYHYEALDKAKGDYEQAIRIFDDDLKRLRGICEVRTICMHGNPLTEGDNRDLWLKYNFKDFGLLGEAYLSFNDDIAYLSDTGRTWGNKHKVKDLLPANTETGRNRAKEAGASSTNDIIGLIKSGKLGPAYLLTHPERWSDSLGGWIINLSLDAGVNFCKDVLALTR